MTSLRGLVGKQLVSQATAEELGPLGPPLIDAHRPAIIAWPIGKGRKAMIVDHDQVAAIGEAAAMLDPGGSLREPATDEERAAAKHDLVLLGALVLSDAGDELGRVVDVDVDADSGVLRSIETERATIDGATILGFGHYALVVRTST